MRFFSTRSGLFAALAAVMVAVMVAAGCSSKASSSTTTNTTAVGGGGTATTVTIAAGGGAAGGSTADQLNAFASSVKAGENQTFKAVYSFTGSGTPGSVTIEQKPPKTVFKSGDGAVIGNGTTTYFCSATGAKPTCISGGSGSANPLAGITQLFNPESSLNAIRAAQAQLAAKAQGYNVSFSTQSFAGVDANCVTVTGAGQTGKYCVTKGGILAYAGTSADNFQLSSFSTSVSDSDFSLPAGATIVTIPGGTP